MSKKLQFKNHPNNPANQPFQLTGTNNLTKKKSWWQVGSDNNPKQRKVKEGK